MTEHSQYFHVCGRELMMQAIEMHLLSIDIEDSFIESL